MSLIAATRSEGGLVLDIHTQHNKSITKPHIVAAMKPQNGNTMKMLQNTNSIPKILHI